jgi:hypothetical protein
MKPRIIKNGEFADLDQSSLLNDKGQLDNLSEALWKDDEPNQLLKGNRASKSGNTIKVKKINS